MKKEIIILFALLTITVAACTTQTIPDIDDTSPTNNNQTEEEGTVQDELEEVQNENIKTLDDGTKYLVHPKSLKAGGPPKDGIPSIDNPKYISVQMADEWIDDNELVLAIIYKGVKRVYPIQIMTYHEIVNDNIAGDPVLITFCPLCGSGIAYNRTINNEPVEFGVSGKLYNSNLVMYDRKTDTYWTQIDGEAIIGELTGQELEAIDVDTTTWGEWKTQHPDSEILSRDTGHSRPYGRDVYLSMGISYRFYPSKETPELTARSIVFGIEINDTYKAYQEVHVKEAGVIEDTVNGVTIRIERDEAGLVNITNQNTGEVIPKERDFWFAWNAFHPNTLIYEPEE